jgi:superfamily II DNA or RNA helicase
MDRKDGTTNVFKMFLGNVVHKAERKNEVNVEIRAVTYKSSDEEFNETILDFRGKPQISSMISKLCTYNRRTEFIIKLLTDFIREDDITEEEYKQNKLLMDQNNPECQLCDKNANYLLKTVCCNVVKYCLPCLNKIETTRTGKERPKCVYCKKVLKFEQNYIENSHVKSLEKCQTIVLAHNINILDYIYTKFVCKNLASVGYYIGGMSEVELKKSEGKQVILATYSMAAEALDIPSLNAEFLITPKTDVVQTVGRVLRAKHKHSDPIIYDIVDTHDTFQNQWLKRKKYYKSQQYKIVKTDSYKYSTNMDEWTTDYDPNKCTKPNTNASTKAKTSLSSFVNQKTNKHNSTERSITSDTEGEEDDDEEQTDKHVGKCLLKFKK